VNADRDAIERLERLGLPYYVTGAWAMAMYAEPRMTRDIDIVLDLDPADYERRIRPAFEDAWLVNDPIDLGGRFMAGAIHAPRSPASTSSSAASTRSPGRR
jgi:hypothetical protein